MRALIIRSPWIDKILAGQKTWELRGSGTLIRETIGLIKGGSGLVVGTCSLVDSRGPLTDQEFAESVTRHRVKSWDDLDYSKVFAWELESARPLRSPVPYKHPAGAVIWVTLPKHTADQVRDAL